MPLTPQQETAVYNRGGSLLVSAAAGSGKTKVLVERLFSYMEQEGCQVDDFLIITYTKAAAAELRGKIAQELTRHNTGLTLYFCVNYGGRAEIGDAVARIAEDVARGRLKAKSVDERTVARYLPEPDMPDVDLFIRSSGEQRTSNFLLWQSAYAEMVFQDRLWPDYDRRDLWAALETYADRERRYGGAVDTPVVAPPAP